MKKILPIILVILFSAVPVYAVTILVTQSSDSLTTFRTNENANNAALNTGISAAFPFTVTGYGISTSTIVGFTNGLLATASSTFTSALRLSSLSSGGLAVGTGGLLYTGATSTLSTISGTLALTQLANQNANTVLVNQTSGSAAPTALATSTFGNTLYGIGTAGYVLSEQTNGTPTWVATTTLSTISGTLALTQLANQNANTVLVNQTGGSAAPTAQATSTFGTNLYGVGTNGRILAESLGVPSWVATTTFSTGVTYANGVVTCDTATASVFGCLTSANWTTFNSKQAPGFQISTTTVPSFAVSNLAYITGTTPTSIGGVATTSFAFSGVPWNLSATIGALVGGNSSTATWWGLATTTQPASSNVLTSDGGKGVYGTATSSTGTASTILALNASQFTTIPNATTTSVSVSQSLNIPSSSSQSPTSAGQSAQDTTDDQFKVGDGTNTSVFSQYREIVFSYATTTAWTGTTTLPVSVLNEAFTYKTVQCVTDVGTLNVQFQYGVTPTKPTMLNASTTIGTFTWTTSNTPTAGATTTVAFGTPVSSPTAISCTIRLTTTAT